MRPLSIRTKLVFTLSFILITAFTVVSVISYQVAKDTVHRHIILGTLPIISDNIYSEIQKDLVRPIFVSSLMAHDTFLKDWAINGEQEIKPIIRYLKEIHEQYGFFTTFYISENTSNYYHFNGLLKQVSPDNDHDVWYYNFKKKNVEYDLDVDTNEASKNDLTIFINHRLEDYDGKLLGVTGVGLNMEKVGRVIDQYRNKYGRVIYLTDREGLIQVHADKTRILKTNVRDIPGMADLAGDMLNVNRESKAFSINREGRQFQVSVRFVPEFDWFLFVEEDETAALRDIRRNFFRNLIIGAATLAIVLIVCIFVVNHYQAKLEHMATTDELTGAFNRREFERYIEQAIYSFHRQQADFSLILVDLDGFKEINDRFGHLVGDKVLREAAMVTRECIRQNDVLVRWGGDEFCILTGSNLDQTRIMAERIRIALAEARFSTAEERKNGGKRGITISCGVAQFRTNDTKETLVVRADMALYKAKEQGRNQTVVEKPE